jgi:hypothetical protein
MPQRSWAVAALALAVVVYALLIVVAARVGTAAGLAVGLGADICVACGTAARTERTR